MRDELGRTAKSRPRAAIGWQHCSAGLELKLGLQKKVEMGLVVT